MAGPLAGRRIVELAAIGPVPLAGMLLSDMGAEVIRVERVQAVPTEPAEPPVWDVPSRGRRTIAIDLRQPDGVAVFLEVVSRCDALLEGFRPGVMERLGIGPEVCRAGNPALVYGRMTGWGQTGPYAAAAGHDLNYLALAGAAAHFARAGQPPTPPLNLVGDYGGGAMFLIFGVLSAMLEATHSGVGQVVDAAMVDGISSLMAMWYGYSHIGRFDEHRPGTHHFDTGAHFFEVYETADGEYVSVAAIEPQFYAELLRLTGLADDTLFAVQRDPVRWPLQKERMAGVFRTRTRAEWCARMEGSDACFAPVLRLSEAAVHPHRLARDGTISLAGVLQPAPAPRFSRSQPVIPVPPSVPGAHTRDVLLECGIDDGRIDTLVASGAVACAP